MATLKLPSTSTLMALSIVASIAAVCPPVASKKVESPATHIAHICEFDLGSSELTLSSFSTDTLTSVEKRVVADRGFCSAVRVAAVLHNNRMSPEDALRAETLSP